MASREMRQNKGSENIVTEGVGCVDERLHVFNVIDSILSHTYPSNFYLGTD